MKRSLLSLTALAVSLLVLQPAAVRATSSASDPKVVSDYVVSVGTDREDATYRRSEQVAFQILLLGKEATANKEVSWTITKDGVLPPIQKGKSTLNAYGKAIVPATLDEAGFLTCDVTFNDGKRDLKVTASAAIDPTEIKPSMPAPDDFDRFWNEKKKALAAVPPVAKMKQVETPPDRPGVDTFDVQVDCIGKPASGYYARPSGAKPKSHPALLYVEGAGVYATDILASVRWAQKGFLTFHINAHGLPVGQPKPFYNDLAMNELKNYRKEGSSSRDTYYFLGMYLRVLRAIDFLAAQPEWDGKTLVIEGVSQGGAQALAGAGLDARASLVVAASPAMCDHTGMVAGRIAGWPKLVPNGEDGKPDPAVLEASRYFDTVNFASRIKAPVKLYIGFADTITPPTGQFAAFNQIQAPKELFAKPEYGHGHDDPKFWSWIADVIVKSAGEQK